jgi:GGDEF domain-containing protein
MFCKKWQVWRYADCLRGNFEAMVEMAAADPLTGLKNRRYLEVHLAAQNNRGEALCARCFSTSTNSKRSMTGVVTPPAITSRWALLPCEKRSYKSGVLCRLGGDEFAAVMPGTDLCAAIDIAETIRASVTGYSLAIAGATPSQLVLPNARETPAPDFCAAPTWRTTRRKRPASKAVSIKERRADWARLYTAIGTHEKLGTCRQEADCILPR